MVHIHYGILVSHGKELDDAICRDLEIVILGETSQAEKENII